MTFLYDSMSYYVTRCPSIIRFSVVVFYLTKNCIFTELSASLWRCDVDLFVHLSISFIISAAKKNPARYLEIRLIVCEVYTNRCIIFSLIGSFIRKYKIIFILKYKEMYHFSEKTISVSNLWEYHCTKPYLIWRF